MINSYVFKNLEIFNFKSKVQFDFNPKFKSFFFFFGILPFTNGALLPFGTVY